MNRINNVNLVSQELLPTPEEVKAALPLSPRAAETVLTGRDNVHRILAQHDPRLFVVVGPCSIHDVRAAKEYAGRLKSLADEVADPAPRWAGKDLSTIRIWTIHFTSKRGCSWRANCCCTWLIADCRPPPRRLIRSLRNICRIWYRGPHP